MLSVSCRGVLDSRGCCGWGVQVDPESPLWRDMQDSGVSCVQLSVSFPDNFPFAPPFVRVLSPHIERGFVMEGGAICMELLTPRGWASAYTVEAILIQASFTQTFCFRFLRLADHSIYPWFFIKTTPKLRSRQRTVHIRRLHKIHKHERPLSARAQSVVGGESRRCAAQMQLYFGAVHPTTYLAYVE